MPTFHKPSLTTSEHSAVTDTAIDIWDVLPAAPSQESSEILSGALIGYRRNGKVALLVADLDLDIWREVVGAPL